MSSDTPAQLSAAEKVLTTTDLLSKVWKGLDAHPNAAVSRKALTRTSKAILHAIGTFATPTYTVPRFTSPTFSIPAPPACVAFQFPAKLRIRQPIGPDAVLDAATGAPWLGSCGATLGSLWLSTMPDEQEWLQQLSPAAGQAPRLQHLSLEAGRLTTASLAAHSLPPSLTSLALLHSASIVSPVASLAALAPLVHLASLDIKACRQAPLSTLPATALRSLTRLNCSAGQDFSGLTALARLSELHIGGGGDGQDSVASLPPLPTVSRLILMASQNCASLAGWASLQSLAVMQCDEIVNASSLSGLQRLTRVAFVSCSNLADISALAGLTSLKLIKLHSVIRASISMAPLVSLPRLTAADFTLDEVSMRLSIAELTALTALTSLRLHQTGSSHLSLPSNVLSPLIRLEELRGVNTSIAIAALDALTRLTALHLNSGITEHFVDLPTVRKLRECPQKAVSHLHVFAGGLVRLAGLRRLQEVTLSGYPYVEWLEFRDCDDLRRLQLTECPRLGAVVLRRVNPLPKIWLDRDGVEVAVSRMTGQDAVLHCRPGSWVDLEAARQALSTAGARGVD